MLLQLVIPAVLAWAGWSWFPPLTVAWTLTQVPFAVAFLGWLLGDPAVISDLFGRVRGRRAASRSPEFLPAGVVSLEQRRRRQREQRRAA